MYRVLMLLAVVLACPGCGDGAHNEFALQKNVHESRQETPTSGAAPTVEDKPARAIGSSDGTVEEQRVQEALAALPRDGQYYVVSGELMRDPLYSEALWGSLVRIDGHVTDIGGRTGLPRKPSGPNVQGFMESRDRSWRFAVWWRPEKYGISFQRKLEAIRPTGAWRMQKLRVWGRWTRTKHLIGGVTWLDCERWEAVEW